MAKSSKTPEKKKDDAEAKNDAPKEEAKPKKAASPGGSFDGARIKKEREKKGLSHDELSARTKISRKILRALEDERYEDMPNARVYVRGFVRVIAREIGLDEDAVSTSYVPRWEAWMASRAEP
ncbi:MAG: helix-turn-helix transcriptional regulator [Deltaproteobacteria bacterium]